MLLNAREILIAHDPSRGELKGVRRMLVQSSLAELKSIGFYERYCACIDPAARSAIEDQIGPGWLPVELAMAHYSACDDIGIDDGEVERLGSIAGEKLARLARTLTLTGASSGPGSPVSPWSLVGAFVRLGQRVCVRP